MTKDVIKLLSEKFPAAFSCDERERRPLKVGIHLDILTALKGAVTPSELKNALHIYTSNRFYRAQSQQVGTPRIDLAGNPAGVVTAKQVAKDPAYHALKAAVTAAQVTSPPMGAPPSSPPAPRRLSLADLRAAGARRKGEDHG
jgi:sRNA-binding protein